MKIVRAQHLGLLHLQMTVINIYPTANLHHDVFRGKISPHEPLPFFDIFPKKGFMDKHPEGDGVDGQERDGFDDETKSLLFDVRCEVDSKDVVRYNEISWLDKR